MEKFNLEIIKDEVSTQYNDMRGFVAIDSYNGINELVNLCQDQGIDMKDFLLIGFGLYIHNFSSGCVDCYVYLVEKDKYRN